MIELRERDGGVIIRIRAQPGARRNAILGEHNGSLKVAVTEQPQNGKANVAIAKLLAKQCGVAKSSVQLLSGASSKHKTFLIAHHDQDHLRQRLLEPW